MDSEVFEKCLTELIASTEPINGLANWHRIPEVQRAYSRLADDFILQATAREKYDSKGSGRGIVIPGGGTKYYPSVWVAVNRIRQLGCNLPIEVWHLGEIEMDLLMKSLLEHMGVTVIDALVHREKHPMRILNGWELKPYSIAHSNFREVLFIDADCVPVKDPSYLFNAAEYEKHGSVFWPDFPHWTLQPEAYKVFGIAHPRNTKFPTNDYLFFDKPIDTSTGWDIPFESGQMLIDKGRCWLQLLLATHYCSHSDYYFNFVYGDKETFHLAWHRLHTRYGMPMQWPGWDYPTVLQHDFDGDIVFAHRTGAKWKTDGNITGQGRTPGERECHDIVKELSAKWNGHVWLNSNPTAEEQAAITSLTGKSFFYHRRGHDARIIELADLARIGNGCAQHEVSWSLFIINNEVRLVISGFDAPTCFLKPSTAMDGRWQGKWLINERMDVELIPVE